MQVHDDVHSANFLITDEHKKALRRHAATKNREQNQSADALELNIMPVLEPSSVWAQIIEKSKPNGSKTSDRSEGQTS